MFKIKTCVVCPYPHPTQARFKFPTPEFWQQSNTCGFWAGGRLKLWIRWLSAALVTNANKTHGVEHQHYVTWITCKTLSFTRKQLISITLILVWVGFLLWLVCTSCLILCWRYKAHYYSHQVLDQDLETHHQIQAAPHKTSYSYDRL